MAELEYFKKHGWEASWIDTACQIVRDEFDRSYASLDIEELNENDVQMPEACLFFLFRIMFSMVTFQIPSDKSSNIFDNLPDLAPALSDLLDELDRYLATDVEDVRDALMWWYERRATFPRLSRMARDYLSIPGNVLR
jgi:hypothetical protein